jgi:Tol biopolymer transport system component
MKLAVALAAASLGIAFGASASQASAPAPIVFAANRAPTVTGEIYRILPNGRRVDLSRSPAQDTSPAVSSDGTRVAFISNRGGHTGVYEVGIDGRRLTALARNVPSLDPSLGAEARLAWQPYGNELAAAAAGTVSILQLGHKPITVRATRFGVSQLWFGVPQPWSPDGQVLLLFHGLNTLRAVSPQGLTLWTQQADYPVGGWSSQGLVAVSANRGVAVYDEVGHVRFKVHLPTTPDGLAWSKDGTRLAVEWGVDHTNLEVLSNTGIRLLKERVPVGDLGWIGDRRVVTGDPWCFTCQSISIDVRTGKTAPASTRWLEPSSADGKLALFARPKEPGFDLGVAPLPRGSSRTYRNVPGCYSDGVFTPAVSVPQFAGQSIVYQSWGPCDSPFDNLYAATGTGIHRVTNVKADETQPALSPDGAELAYVWAAYTGLSCKGCSDGIRIASASGKAIRTLTDPPDCAFDDSPTWSPDGMTILYTESTCNSPGELFTIPAGGGTPHDLGVAGWQPAWGPTRIAYVNGGVWTANPDGSDPTLVLDNGTSPTWSPAGQLAYLVGKNIVIGSKVMQLPFTEVGSLRWTPDGTRLLITATQANKSGGPGPFDLYTLKPNGKGLKRLTKNYGVN